MSTSFVRERSGTLFSSSSSYSRNLLLWIENNQFRVLYPVFFFFFFNRNLKEKICVVTAIILYRDDTLDEEDVLIIFDELEVPNSPLQISFS